MLNLVTSTNPQRLNIVTFGNTQRLNVAYVTSPCSCEDSASGDFYLNSNPSGFLNTLSGLSVDYVTGISGYLQSLITVSSAGVSSINLLSGALELIGQGGISVSTSGQTIIFSGASSSIANLSGYLTTGQADLRYYGINNPSGFITGFDSGSYSLKTELNSISGRVISLNGLSGYLSLAATGLNFLTANGQTIYISGSGVSWAELISASGSLNNQIANSGSYLYSLIQSSAAGVSSLNSYSGSITLTGAGSITVISNSQNFTISGAQQNAGLSWNFVTGDTNMTANNGYIVSGVTGLVNLYLPQTFTTENIFEITSICSGWRVRQNTNQSIYFGVERSTIGTAGYLQSTHDRDSIRLVGVNANKDLNVLSSVGNIGIN